MKKKLITIVILLYCYFVFGFFNQTSAAFSFQIASASPSLITTKNDEIIVSLSITDLPSESYFRIAFQKNDGGNYFGYMKNDLGEWTKTSESCTKFYRVTDKTLTKLEIPLKIGDTELESGIYNIKSHRYTLSCSSTSSTNFTSIEIALPTSTPTTMPTRSEIQVPSPTIYESPTLTPTSVLINNIFLSEVMVHPRTEEKEWVEIYNDNDFDIMLIDWLIDDIENGGTTPKKFSLNIPAKNYKVIVLTTNIFNDSGDVVRLLDSNKNVIDEFEYAGSTEDYTYGRTLLEDNNFCLQTASFETANNNCFEPTTKPTPTEKSYPKYLNQTNPTITHTQIKTITSLRKPTIKPISFKTSAKSELVSDEKILGTSTKISNNFITVKILSFISFSYSLLTILSVLFKMKIIYGRLEKIFSSFIYSERRK